MIPNDVFAEDFVNTVIRIGLYFSAAFQIVCLIACVKLTDTESDIALYDKLTLDSDDCSSEQSSPGHKAAMTRTRRYEKKKRR